MIIHQQTIQSTKITIFKITKDFDFYYNKLKLDDKEQKYFDKIKNDFRRKQWLAVRYFTSSLFCKKINIHYQHSGKPFIVNSEINISISHTKDLVAIALNEKHPIGIDIEQFGNKIEKIANRFLSSQELQLINNEDSVKFKTLFWSAKESIYKNLEITGISFKEGIKIKKIDKQKLIAIVNEKEIVVNYVFMNFFVLSLSTSQ